MPKVTQEVTELRLSPGVSRVSPGVLGAPGGCSSWVLACRMYGRRVLSECLPRARGRSEHFRGLLTRSVHEVLRGVAGDDDPMLQLTE